jgi:hypothetical protein
MADSNARLGAKPFEAWERMDSAIVHQEDDVPGTLMTWASLADRGDENIFEPGPENGPINKALGS